MPYRDYPQVVYEYRTFERESTRVATLWYYRTSIVIFSEDYLGVTTRDPAPTGAGFVGVLTSDTDAKGLFVRSESVPV